MGNLIQISSARDNDPRFNPKKGKNKIKRDSQQQKNKLAENLNKNDEKMRPMTKIQQVWATHRGKEKKQKNVQVVNRS